MTHEKPTPVDNFMAKREHEKYPRGEWSLPDRWWLDKYDYLDPQGNKWVRILCGPDPRYKSPEDVAKGLPHYWDSPEYWKCEFVALPMRRLHDDFYAVIVFKLHTYERQKYCNTKELVIDLVPCDYSGPDPVMRDVA